MGFRWTRFSSSRIITILSRLVGRKNCYSWRRGGRCSPRLQLTSWKKLVLRYECRHLVSVSVCTIPPSRQNCHHRSAWFLYTWFSHPCHQQHSFFGRPSSYVWKHWCCLVERFLPYGYFLYTTSTYRTSYFCHQYDFDYSLSIPGIIWSLDCT